MRAFSGKKNKLNPAKNKTGRCDSGRCQGRLNIVGIGPGNKNHLSPAARRAIEESEVVVGYKTYLGLLGGLTRGKEIISSGMMQEIERASLAIKRAGEGKRVALISSGDPGVYGMAGAALELLDGKERIEIEIVPGVIAATSCASLLGAPLMHDFAVISLSDLLTDLKLIKKRITMAAKSDFVIVFYNPQSPKRTLPLKAAWEILMKHKSPDTPVGIVRNAARDGEEAVITTLKDMLKAARIDMTTTIIVGNSSTYIKGRHMITPRGYSLVEDKE